MTIKKQNGQDGCRSKRKEVGRETHNRRNRPRSSPRTWVRIPSKRSPDQLSGWSNSNKDRRWLGLPKQGGQHQQRGGPQEPEQGQGRLLGESERLGASHFIY